MHQGAPAAGRTPVRVVLADDAPFIREAIAGLLRQEGFQVAAQAGDPAALHQAVRSVRPDIAVIDIRMPPSYRVEGLEAAVEIRQLFPEVGLLLLSQHLESRYLDVLLAGGARRVGYLLKERVSGVETFVEAVRRVAAGGCVVDPAVVSLMTARRRSLLEQLTERERQVLALMAEGRSNLGISRQMFLSLKTVESHVRSIFWRLCLAPAPDDHRRVLAVLTYLNAPGAEHPAG